VCVCVPVAISYFGLSSFIDKIEGTHDERIYSDSDAIENIVEKSMVVAF
jgi:hypothetical protein